MRTALSAPMCPRCGGINCTILPDAYICADCPYGWPRAPPQHLPVTPTPPNSFPVFTSNIGVPSSHPQPSPQTTSGMYGCSSPSAAQGLYRGNTTGYMGYDTQPSPQTASGMYGCPPPPAAPRLYGGDTTFCPKCKSKHYFKSDGRLMRCLGCNCLLDPDGKIVKPKPPKTFKCPSCKRTKPVKEKEYGTTICRVCAEPYD